MCMFFFVLSFTVLTTVHCSYIIVMFPDLYARSCADLAQGRIALDHSIVQTHRTIVHPHYYTYIHIIVHTHTRNSVHNIAHKFPHYHSCIHSHYPYTHTIVHKLILSCIQTPPDRWQDGVLTTESVPHVSITYERQYNTQIDPLLAVYRAGGAI